MSEENKNTTQLKDWKEANASFTKNINYNLFDFNSFSYRYDFIHSIVFEKTIEDIQASLLSHTISCVDLVKYYIYRMSKYSDYNAVISINPNIIEEAQKMDEKICSGVAKELFGTVILLKDNIALASLPTTAGAYALRYSTTTRDANLVSRLKKKDALIIGKSNLAEWGNCMSMPSLDGYSTLGGHTKNPYGDFEVGSSSSGSAVGVSLNLATISIGTEFCGSLIGPAGQNSSVSLKPSIGLVDNDLIIRISNVIDTAGPMGRTVEDVYKAFKVMIGYKDGPASEMLSCLKMNEKLGVSKTKRVGVYHSIGEDMSQLIKDFKDLGIEVVPINFDHVDFTKYNLKPITEYGVVHNVQKYLENVNVISDFKSLQEIVAYNEENNCIPYGQKIFIDALKADYEKDLVEEQVLINKEISTGAIDYLLDKYNLDMLLSVNMHLAALYAPAGYPALTVPAGYKESGEPFAMTLVGSYLSDVRLFETAKLFEDTYSYRKPPME